MKTFVIESTNCVKAFPSSEKARQCRDGTRFLAHGVGAHVLFVKVLKYSPRVESNRS
jgi:hypothetical protein